MSLLIRRIEERIEGRISLEELAQALADARTETVSHRQEAIRMLAGVPHEMVKPERDELARAYDGYEELIAEAEKGVRDSSELKRVAELMPAALEQIGIALVGVREVAWAARGPSTHPGANELLALLEGLADEQELEDELDGVLERELVRIEHQWPKLETLPDFVRKAQEASLKSYEEWLRGMLDAPGDDPRTFEEMIEELEEWALDYSAHDLEFLHRRYSSVPTAIPAVNFALNCQHLELEELVLAEMADYAVDAALEALREGSRNFQEIHSLSDVERLSYQAAVERLLVQIEELPEAEDREDLQRRARGIRELTDGLMAVHQRAEGTAQGSRMDYKDQSS